MNRSTSIKCSFCERQCKNANSLRNHERLCKNNPQRTIILYNNLSDYNQKRKQGEIRSWNAGLTADNNASIASAQQKLKEYYKTHPGHGTGRIFSRETREKLSKAATISNMTKFDRKSGRGKRGYYQGIYCQSSWELAYVVYLLEHDIPFIRNKKFFPYTYENKTHQYCPDFYLIDTDEYVEIKGYYDERSKAKAAQFPEKLIVICKEEMQPILDYVINKYGESFTYLYHQDNGA